MIQLSDLTNTFGDRVLFDHVTWQITDRERVGLCGPNGAGKTTLLKMMAGLDEPDEGAILKPSALTVGYLPQDGLNHAGRSVFDEASSAFGELLAMKAEMHALEDRLGDESIPEAEHDAMLHRYSDLQDRFRVHDGYSIELKTSTVLQGLGFKTSDFERPTETFSLASASRAPTWSATPASSPAAGRCASRWPSCCCAAPPSCCSTSRPTTSTSKRATGSRST
jgi:ATP-binding cassette subfamily F protein 3